MSVNHGAGDKVLGVVQQSTLKSFCTNSPFSNLTMIGHSISGKIFKIHWKKWGAEHWAGYQNPVSFVWHVRLRLGASSLCPLSNKHQFCEGLHHMCKNPVLSKQISWACQIKTSDTICTACRSMYRIYINTTISSAECWNATGRLISWEIHYWPLATG